MALELGIGVSKPIGDQRYDLIFDLGGPLMRVQCKWASRHGDVIIVRCYSARRTADGLLRRLYNREEVDAFVAYCAETRSCYLLGFDDLPPGGIVQLRLARPRNNQQLGVRWAKLYELDATLMQHQGAIAQLGERLAGSQKGTGSSPVGSIRKRPTPEVGGGGQTAAISRTSVSRMLFPDGSRNAESMP
jgi:hypothetical protein